MNYRLLSLPHARASSLITKWLRLFKRKIVHHSCVDYSQKGDITVSTIPTSVTEDQFNDHIRPYLNTAKRGYECSIPLDKVFNWNY